MLVKGPRIRRRRAPPMALQITSLLDIMTILLFFLLKSYSASVSINLADNLQLPKSTSIRPPLNALNIAVSKKEVTIDGEVVVTLEDSPVPGFKKLPKTVFKEDPDLVVPLLDILQEKRSLAKDAESRDSRLKFFGDCIVQADKSIPYQMIRKILYTAGQAGYVMLNLAVLQVRE